MAQQLFDIKDTTFILYEKTSPNLGQALESQDDFIIAKLLVPADSEVQVGSPIMVTVEKKEDVAAFANFKVAAVIAAAPKPVVAAPPVPAPTIVAAPVVKAAPAAVAAPAPAKAPVTTSNTTVTVSTTGIYSIPHSQARVSSPFATKSAADMQKYISLYGACGHSSSV